MKISQIGIAVLLGIVAGSSTVAEALTIGTFDVDRGGIGSLLSDDRAEVRDALVESFFAVTIDGAPVLTEAWASTLDLLWLDAVKEGLLAIDPLSAAEQLVLGQFLSAGGGVIIFTDTDFFAAANLSLLAPFGLVAEGSLSGNQHVTVTDPPASPVTDGVFGEIAGYGTSYSGWYSELGGFAVGLATLDANGQIHLAYIARAVMGPAAGAAVFMADHRTDSIPLMLNAVMAVTDAAIPTAVGAGAVPALSPQVVIYPNPFNPRTTIGFTLTDSAPAELTIHGLDGSQIATLIDGIVAAGPHSVQWDGCDAEGQRLASGIYLCRLETLGRITTARMALVR